MTSLSDWFKLGLSKPSGTDWEEHSAIGDISTGRRFKAVGIPPVCFQQATNASLTFYGTSNPGTNATLPQWRIMAEDTNGNITFAQGNDQFINMWSTFATYSYF
jgi:hypothetical protein